MGEKRHNRSNAGVESSDLNVAPIVWFLTSLTVSTVIIFLLMGGLVNLLESRAEKAEGKLSPFASERDRIPPEPRVQLAPSRVEQVEGNEGPDLKDDHPLVEMERVRREENEKLSSYSWVDEKNGVVRIPIDEAKRLLLERGLPIRQKKLQILSDVTALTGAVTTENGGSEKAVQK